MNFKTSNLLELNQKTLVSMLEYKRPHDSHSEKNFINRFIKPFIDFTDSYGNLYAFIDGVKNDKLPTLAFTAHTDTVHRTGGKQVINITQGSKTSSEYNDNFASVINGECLGADDGVGVFLQLAMIQHFRKNPPNENMVFCFFRNEEMGGVGSSKAIDKTAKLEPLKTIFDNLEIIISLDRKGTADIITHQSGGRCCSDEFAKQFEKHFDFKSATGSFTDSANFMNVYSNSGFKECTNLSVGYYQQHTKNEYLNLTFVAELQEKLISFKWHNLKTFRKFDDIDEFEIVGGYGGLYTDYSASYQYKSIGTYKSPSSVNKTHLKELAQYDPMGVLEFLNEMGLTEQFILEKAPDFLDLYGFSVDEINQFSGGNS